MIDNRFGVLAENTDGHHGAVQRSVKRGPIGSATDADFHHVERKRVIWHVFFLRKLTDGPIKTAIHASTVAQPLYAQSAHAVGPSLVCCRLKSEALLSKFSAETNSRLAASVPISIDLVASPIILSVSLRAVVLLLLSKT